MQAETTVADFDCTGGRGCNASVSPNGEMAAGGNSVDSCFGDSGGPLYLKTEVGDYLVGVTSRGYDDAIDFCGEGGIYTRADAVVDWIEEESGQEIPRATCNSPPVANGDPFVLDVDEGQTVTATITVEDPDAADTHTFQIGRAPDTARPPSTPRGGSSTPRAATTTAATSSPWWSPTAGCRRSPAWRSSRSAWTIRAAAAARPAPAQVRPCCWRWPRSSR